MVLNDGKWTTTRGEEEVNSGAFKIVAIEDGVQQVETMPATGEYAGKPGRHLSKLEGNKLTLCRTADNQKLPTEFSSKPGSGHRLSVWVREKP
jgi:uncharacterized protein (TIGR03067 family)